MAERGEKKFYYNKSIKSKFKEHLIHSDEKNEQKIQLIPRRITNLSCVFRNKLIQGKKDGLQSSVCEINEQYLHNIS